MQIKENTTFLSLLKLFKSLEWTKKWFVASFETYIQEGYFLKNKTHKSIKT